MIAVDYLMRGWGFWIGFGKMFKPWRGDIMVEKNNYTLI